MIITRHKSRVFKILKSLRMFKNFNHHVLNELVIGEKKMGASVLVVIYLLHVYLLYNILVAISFADDFHNFSSRHKSRPLSSRTGNPFYFLPGITIIYIIIIQRLYSYTSVSWIWFCNNLYLLFYITIYYSQSVVYKPWVQFSNGMLLHYVIELKSAYNDNNSYKK